LIYLVFSIQFFNLPCLFAKFYWYILTVDKYFIFSALSFLQTEGLRKCKKDHAKCLTTYDEISRWNSKRIRRTYYQYERKISAQVAFVSTEISKKEKREFSHSIPRHDSMWMFMILLYVPVTILYDIYIGTVLSEIINLLRKWSFPYNIFRARKAVNLLSIIFAVDADKSISGVQI